MITHGTVSNKKASPSVRFAEADHIILHCPMRKRVRILGKPFLKGCNDQLGMTVKRKLSLCLNYPHFML